MSKRLADTLWQSAASLAVFVFERTHRPVTQ